MGWVGTKVIRDAAGTGARWSSKRRVPACRTVFVMEETDGERQRDVEW